MYLWVSKLTSFFLVVSRLKGKYNKKSSSQTILKRVFCLHNLEMISHKFFHCIAYEKKVIFFHKRLGKCTKKSNSFMHSYMYDGMSCFSGCMITWIDFYWKKFEGKIRIKENKYFFHVGVLHISSWCLTTDCFRHYHLLFMWDFSEH